MLGILRWPTFRWPLKDNHINYIKDGLNDGIISRLMNRKVYGLKRFPLWARLWRLWSKTSGIKIKKVISKSDYTINVHYRNKRRKKFSTCYVMRHTSACHILHAGLGGLLASRSVPILIRVWRLCQRADLVMCGWKVQYSILRTVSL